MFRINPLTLYLAYFVNFKSVNFSITLRKILVLINGRFSIKDNIGTKYLIIYIFRITSLF